MGRAARRQAQSKRGRRQRRDQKVQPPIRPATRPQQQRESASSRGVSSLRPTWALDIISELQKVTWPTAADTRYLTIVVLIVAGAFALFLGGVDIFFNWFIENTLLS